MKGTRIKRLLSYLMVTEGWHSAEELASYLHTTTRTIRNYMHELQSRPDVMIESSVRGYRWAPGSSIAYVAMYPSDTTPFTPTDRMLYALRHFLWLEKIPVETLMQELMVSDRTFDQDLNRLRKLFRQFGLSLHRRRDVLLLTGMETGRRRLILFCIKQVSKVDYLTLDFLVSGFRYLDVQFVHKTLMSVLPKHNLHINGYQVYELLLLMLIQIEQIQRGNLIEPLQNQYQFISQSPDYAASVEISTQINRHSAVAYTSSEVFYLALLLFCKTACISDIYPSGIPFYEDNKAATRDCLHTAEQLLTINYSQENFPAHLAHYFSRMQVRQQMQLSTPCTLLRTLRNVHPLLVDTAAQIPAVIRLLYCCGFRIGEVLRLRVKDVDLDTGIITVHNGKGGKDRLVPVHNSVIEYLRSYSAQLPDEREWFFPSACGHYSIKTIYDNFRELLFACNIPHTGNGPRVHDFRHTFAVHTLEKQLSDGYDPMVIVPRLAAYLGHKSYRETCWYIHLTVLPAYIQRADPWASSRYPCRWRSHRLRSRLRYRR